jgi:ribosome-binding factor A
MEAPRAVTEIKQRKSMRLARVAAQIRRALSRTLSQRKVRDPGLYPMGLPIQVIEVEITADLRVARIRWQLPVAAGATDAMAATAFSESRRGAPSTRPVDQGVAAVDAAAAEWGRRASGALDRGPGSVRINPHRQRRERQRKQQREAETAAVRRHRARGVRASGVQIAADDSDLDWDDDDSFDTDDERDADDRDDHAHGMLELGPRSRLQLRRELSSPEIGLGGLSSITQDQIQSLTRSGTATEASFRGRAAAAASSGSHAEGADASSSLSWRLDQTVLKRQLAQWRSQVRSGTVKPTMARVMRWAEDAAVPTDPILRSAFKSTRAALERCAPALRVQVAAQVPLRLSPRLEFHAWVGVQPAELLNAARRGMTQASSLAPPAPHAAQSSSRA